MGGGEKEGQEQEGILVCVFQQTLEKNCNWQLIQLIKFFFSCLFFLKTPRITNDKPRAQDYIGRLCCLFLLVFLPSSSDVLLLRVYVNVVLLEQLISK